MHGNGDAVSCEAQQWNAQQRHREAARGEGKEMLINAKAMPSKAKAWS